MNSPKPHATIVGAGSIGVSSAVFLQAEGYDVTIIDRVPPGEGCSFGNAGGVVPCGLLPEFHAGVISKLPGWLFDPLGPLHIRWRHFPRALPWFLKAARSASPKVAQAITEGKAALSLRVLSDYDDIMRMTGTSELLNKVDGIRLFDSEAQYLGEARNREKLKHYGIDQKQISAGELRELEPDIADDFYCGTWYDVWYSLRNPATFVARMAEAVVRNGGKVLQDEVILAEHDGSRAFRLVLRDGGVQTVDKLVIAAARLFGPAGEATRHPDDAGSRARLSPDDPGPGCQHQPDADLGASAWRHGTRSMSGSGWPGRTSSPASMRHLTGSGRMCCGRRSRGSCRA